MTNELNQEQEAVSDVVSFGEYILQPLPQETRKDVEEIRLLVGAVLNRLHLTLGGNENNPTGNALIQAAINQVIIAGTLAERALHFSDEVGFEVGLSEELKE